MLINWKIKLIQSKHHEYICDTESPTWHTQSEVAKMYDAYVICLKLKRDFWSHFSLEILMSKEWLTTNIIFTLYTLEDPSVTRNINLPPELEKIWQTQGRTTKFRHTCGLSHVRRKDAWDIIWLKTVTNPGGGAVFVKVHNSREHSSPLKEIKD